MLLHAAAASREFLRRGDANARSEHQIRVSEREDYQACVPVPPTGTPTLPPPLSSLRDEEDERGEDKEKLLAGGLVPGNEEE